MDRSSNNPPMRHRAIRLPVIIAMTLAISLGGLALLRLTPFGHAIMLRLQGQATVAQRLAEVGDAARGRMRSRFEAAGVPYPPASAVLIGLKDRKELEVWAPSSSGAMRRVHTYPILAASGRSGPKLREGDMQVPEGFYEIESLHPNSMYHLALRLNYPNDADRARAREEGRSDLGSDIMIHGRSSSAGCLAMGDPAIEELFVLAADIGIERVKIILAPTDFRTNPPTPPNESLPVWTAELYEAIASELHKYSE